ncbi:MAG TPA: hypothetical protein VFR79_16595 [Nitrospira sp.]|nr:hypothetical protein [Nitrospira sp.]
MVHRRDSSNQQKAAAIKEWINPEERVTVQFEDQRDLSAEVTGCTDQLVSLSLDTAVPHMRQEISLPLSSVEISEDHSHYTRDPDRPLKRKRLMLIAHGKRPSVV